MKSFKEYIQEEGSGGLFAMYPEENPGALPFHPDINPEGYKPLFIRPTMSNPITRPKPKPKPKPSPVKKFMDTSFGNWTPPAGSGHYRQ
jgi:hypothetical protein